MRGEALLTRLGCQHRIQAAGFKFVLSAHLSLQRNFLHEVASGSACDGCRTFRDDQSFSGREQVVQAQDVVHDEL